MKKELCKKCGKRARLHCPALDGPICSYCCGNGRGSTIDCDPLCSRYPLGTENYDLWLKLDGVWTEKAADRLFANLGQRDIEQRIMAMAMNPESDKASMLGSGFFGCLIHGLFREKVGPTGETRAQIWEADGWTGLNNDGRVINRYAQNTYLTVIEIQGIVWEGLSFEALDLLDPARGPFTMYDRALANQVLPYTRLLTWVTHFPHFSRAGGVALILEHSLASDFIATIHERACSQDSEEVYTYLIEHHAEVIALKRELENRRQEEMISSFDARSYTSSFRLERLRKVEAKLRAGPEFLLGYPDEDDSIDWPGQIACYDWIRHANSCDAPEVRLQRFITEPDGSPGPEVIATLRLFPDRLVTETLGSDRTLYIRGQLDALFGDLLVFDNEKIDDLGERARQKGNPGMEKRPAIKEFAPTLHPKVHEAPASIARLPMREQVEDLEQIEYDMDLGEGFAPPTGDDPDSLAIQATEAFMQKTYRDLLDSPVPALDQLSPREAAARPEMAARLADWAKMHVHSIAEHRATKGGKLELAWFFEELGIANLWKA